MLGVKRYLAIMVILLAALLASCGGGDAEPSDGTPAPRGEFPTPESSVTITFWHSMTAAPAETLTQLTRRFNATHPWARVELVFQGGYDDMLNKVLASLGTADLPPLMQIQDTSTRIIVDSGAFVPVQDFIDRDGYDLSDFPGAVLDYYTVDGKLYPMPFNTSDPLLYYNKTAFREVGLDPEKPPTTLEEVREYSRKLVPTYEAGIALEIKPERIEHLLAAHGDLYVDNANGRQDRPTQVVFDGEAGLALFRWWDEMLEEGLAIDVGRNPGGIEHFLAVASGRVAMTIGTSAALRSVVDALESGEVTGMELGVGFVPVLDEGDCGVLVGGASLWINKDKPVEEQEAAWEYIKYLLAPEQQAEWYSGSGYLPLRMSARDLPAAIEVETNYPAFRIAVDELMTTPRNDATAGPLVGPYAQIREEVTSALERMILQGVSPEDALREAADKADQAIQDYRRRLGR